LVVYENLGMKIGIVLYPTYGGSGVVATELGKALAILGHEIHFISYSMPARLQSFMENIVFHEVGVANYPLFEYPPYESALAGKIVDVVKFEKLDVLHVHYAIPHASAGYMAKQILKTKGIEIPIVTTLHGTDITIVGRDASLKPVVEFSINRSDAVTAVSEHLKNETLAHFDVANDIDVVYNFIDTERFRDQDKQHFKKAIAPNDEKILLHVSNFRQVKRIQDIIAAFEIAHRSIRCKLILVGDGPERQKLETLARKLGVWNDVRFLGKQDAIDELLNVADVFLMASERESFGLAALEAMAAGVPVISSNAGGLPELNLHGKTGFVFPVSDVEAFADSLKQLLTDEELLTKFKKQAQAHARTFATEEIVGQYLEIYERVRITEKSSIA